MRPIAFRDGALLCPGGWVRSASRTKSSSWPGTVLAHVVGRQEGEHVLRWIKRQSPECGRSDNQHWATGVAIPICFGTRTTAIGKADIRNVGYQQLRSCRRRTSIPVQEQYRNSACGGRIHLPMEPALQLANPDAARR